MPRNTFLQPLISSAEAAQDPQRLPEENLRDYVHLARLFTPHLAEIHPPIYQELNVRIPLDQFLLSIQPDSRFRLRKMKKERYIGIMCRQVATFMLQNIPSRPIQVGNPRGHIRTANFNLPAPGFMTFAEPLPLIDNAMGFAKLLSQVLESVEGVLNLVWPEASRGLTFIIPTDSVVPEADADLCVPMYYTKVRESDLVNFREPMVKLVVLVLPPWVLGMAEMYDMTSMTRFPAFEMNPDGTRPNFTRIQKVWAQIYDCCASKNCPFFAVTNYSGWIFGAFDSAFGMSQAYCTRPLPHLEYDPCIFEWLIFWCASALKLPGTWRQPISHSSSNPEVGNHSYIQIQSEFPIQSMGSQQWIDEYLDDDRDQANFYTTEVSLANPNIWETTIHY